MLSTILWSSETKPDSRVARERVPLKRAGAERRANVVASMLHEVEKKAPDGLEMSA